MNDNKTTNETHLSEAIPEFIPMDTKVTSIVLTTPHTVNGAGDIIGREIQLALTLEGRADPLLITTRGWMVPNRTTDDSTRYLRLNGEEWISRKEWGREWVGGWVDEEVLEERSRIIGEELANVSLASTRPPTHRSEFKHSPLSGALELLEVLEELGMRKVSP